MKKAYLVVEKNYEYNDEIYHTGEEDAWKPKKVYADKEKAIETAKRLNMKAFVDADLASYGYTLSDLSSKSRQRVYEMIGKILGIDEDTWNNSIEEGLYHLEKYFDKIKKLNQADLEIITQAFNEIKFFEVLEIDAEV